MGYWKNMITSQEVDDWLMERGDAERKELTEDLNNKAKTTCEWETTTETKGEQDDAN